MPALKKAREPQRAVDDPVTLARAARITRDAAERKRQADAAVAEIVAAAPPLTGEQLAELRRLLPPVAAGDQEP
jgi:hypothetical protein